MAETMVFGVILAGGDGQSMEQAKQYQMLGNKPVLVHTIEKFYIHKRLEKILVLCPKKWLDSTQNMMEQYFPRGNGRIVLTESGTTRNETILNAVHFMEKQYGLTEDILFVTHDSVRPFVSYRIIEENIEYGLKYGVVDTVIPSSDTIVYSEDAAKITSVPKRSIMYQGQTPQTFPAFMFKKLYQDMKEEEKAVLTDACKVFVLNGEKVHLVEGENANIKITYPYDLKVAESLMIP